ncbi:hypothetical protein N5K37_32430 [Delftia tsuruhatensis]|uniref:hypothetical protein n=1 Tax=Delftia tsuruhatensis TaxID=180282 RepID=UPI002447AFB8|nr:hypothetical protein [Delftia tsuruhatensis]MDH2234618.1 hypothetical protein [Delftia tsuruhatensis]
MSEAINSRPGPWLSEGNWTYTLQHAGWRRGEEQFENRLFAQVQPGRNSSLAEANSIASLFAEAGNVLHETGLTPRQLVEQRDALAAALAGLDEAYCRAGTPLSRDERTEDRKRLIAARAALALVKGATP